MPADTVTINAANKIVFIEACVLRHLAVFARPWLPRCVYHYPRTCMFPVAGLVARNLHSFVHLRVLRGRHVSSIEYLQAMSFRATAACMFSCLPASVARNLHSFVYLRVLRGFKLPKPYTCSLASPSATGTSIFFFPR